MSEESRNRAAFDPTELWKQWYEAGTRMWSNVLGGGTRESYMDPFGLYRQWFNDLESTWKRMFDSAGKSPSPSPFTAMTNNPMMALMMPATAMQGSSTAKTPVEAPKTAAALGAAEAENLWKQWFEAAAESWQKAAAFGMEAINLTPRWLEMLEQMRHNFFSAEGLPTDPLQFATRWYNATSGPLSEFVGDLLEREDILEPSSQFLRHYASFYKVFRRDSEEYLKALSIPVRSDIARVAGLVVALEDKVDHIEDTFEDFQYGQASATEPLQAVEERIDGLERTLERIEGGATEAATADSVSGLVNRLDGVEAKLDQLLAALENTSQNGTQEAAPREEAEASRESNPQADGEIVATAAARRKAEELGMDLSQVSGTGANGQITVDDVRRENAREGGEG